MKKKLKFVRSLLNPSEMPSPPLLIKQRVPIKNQFSLPSFRKTGISWMPLFKTSTSDLIPLRRTLISTQSSQGPLGSISSRSKAEDKTSLTPNLNPKSKSKPNPNKSSQSSKSHLRTCSGFGLFFDPKPLTQSTRSPVLIPTSTSSNFLSKSVSNYVRTSFDSSVIPEKNSNLLTVQDVVRYIEYSNRPMFK